MDINISLCNQLTELVVFCDLAGIISYANPAAQRWSDTPLKGQPFSALLMPESSHKGTLFFEVARRSSCREPMLPWELTLGTAAQYTVANFHGYSDNGCIVVIGRVAPDETNEMQQELLQLTLELAETQREQRRQNRILQEALQEQRYLLKTIHDLTAPAVPIWEGVLLLPLIGQIDSHRANAIASELLQRVSHSRTRYVILDVSGIAMVDTAVARHLIDTAQMLRLLGAQPILVGINSDIAHTLVHLGLNLHDFITVRSDVQHAVAYVLYKMNEA
jgi:anti-anti-sigma factor